ncbi:hypothetical protein, partial [Enterobacter intestinihominis]
GVGGGPPQCAGKFLKFNRVVARAGWPKGQNLFFYPGGGVHAGVPGLFLKKLTSPPKNGNL